jgi:hypothetical protein
MSYAQISYPQFPLGDGSCGETIASAGCYVTTDAMLLTWMGHAIDPPHLNAEYLEKGLFSGGCLIGSDTVARARPTQVALELVREFPGAADLTLCDTQTDGVYVAVRIAYPHGTAADVAAGRVHFAPLYDYSAGANPSTLRIVDSYDGQIKPLARYGDPATIITAAMRYRALSANVPALLPDPIQPPTPPPAPAEAPPAD